MNRNADQHTNTNRPKLWVAMLTTAMAAGMGWGIRGQYGHETGAMIAGALASLTLVLLFVPSAGTLVAARAAAMMTVGIGIGGTMTYGQTVGLTHNREMVGNWEALQWGMLGLGIKGGIWISFAATFLGMGLSKVRYRPLEMLCLMLGLIACMFFGRWLLNSPFDPANKVLPSIYFSASWHFEPDKVDLKPRAEIWGGLLIALAALILYAIVKRDWLAIRLGLIGCIGGGLGFPGGQSLQAYHAWNLEAFSTGWLSKISVFKYFNWWNMMETTFGLIFGATLGLGVWLNQRSIAITERDDSGKDEVRLSPTLEVGLLSVHMILLLCAEFIKLPGWASIVGQYTNYGLIMCVIPMVGVVGGRLWPYLLVLPVVAAPICGKQMRSIVFSKDANYLPEPSWVLFVMIPMAITLVVSAWLISESIRGTRARSFAAVALLTNLWIFFGLNTFFFDFAFPWREWTARTPNQLIFAVCTLSLTGLAITSLRRGNTVETP